MLSDIQKLTSNLEKLISTKIVAEGVKTPPRLVRANSAFELAKALHKVQENPEFVELLRGIK